MTKIGIIVNYTKDPLFVHLREIIDWLLHHDCIPLIPDDTSALMGDNTYAADMNEMFSVETRFIIVLGGDGTILQIAGKAAIFGIPILGINLGTLGYLTDAGYDEGFASLEKVLAGDYYTERRMLLSAESPSIPAPTEPLALNEFCVSKGAISRMIVFDIYLNNLYINTYRADGVIIATPTGSSAYNLSAGGPILKSDGDMVAITPICPHDIFTRSCIVSGEDVIRVQIVSGENILFSVDGRPLICIEAREYVDIKASKHYLNIIKTNGLSFFDILRRKMSR
ncbi:NAD kinase [Clostridia bacterium]|nr:NAD kinase [Clostridia bacterium]GHU75311.1 NAD kinase [Clostridia bacterium]